MRRDVKISEGLSYCNGMNKNLSCLTSQYLPNSTLEVAIKCLGCYEFGIIVVFSLAVDFGTKYYVCMVITCSKRKDQPGKVANPARGQLNGENEYFPVPVRA